MNLKPGDPVRLRTPDNPRLDGAAAIVQQPTDYGAVVLTAAAATGTYRAGWGELDVGAGPTPPVPPASANGHSTGLVSSKVARSAGYTGDVCEICGGSKMRRNGSCLLCDDCGSTSGCS